MNNEDSIETEATEHTDDEIVKLIVSNKLNASELSKIKPLSKLNIIFDVDHTLV